MIGSKCRRIRRNNQFNNVLLNAQDKVNCSKITEIREERNANSIYTGSATSRAYVQSSSNPLKIFHYLCKSFTDFEQTLRSPTVVFKILQEIICLLITILKIQETISLLLTIDFLTWTKIFLSFRVDDTNWRF